MAEFSNQQKEEIKEVVMETLAEQGSAIEDLEEVDTVVEGDLVPVVREENGVKRYVKVPTEVMAGGVTVVIVNDLTTGGANKALSAEMGKTLNQKIEAISSGAALSMSVSPSVIYKGTAQQVTVSASVSKVTPQTIKIMDGSTEVASASDSGSVQKAVSINITSNTKTYTGEATYNGVKLDGSVTVSARYPIYCGCGTSASAIATDANKIGATTTAARTYSKTTTANGQYLFILVPSDISGLTQFSMGGAPFAMDAETSTTIGGVTYKVYKSGNSYNSGTALSVKAE